MKIAIVAHLPDFPASFAASRRVEMLTRGLAERGHTVSVIIPRKLTPGPMETRVDGVRVYWHYAIKGTNSLVERIVARWRAWRAIVAMLKRNDLDWLLLFNLGFEGLPMSVSARLNDCRVGAVYGDLRFHSKNMTVENRARLIWLEMADLLLPKLSHLNIVDTTFLERRLRKIAPHIPTIVVPPLVDQTVFHYDAEGARAFRARWGLEGFSVIGYMGSFWMINGVANLLQAGRILVERGKRIKLLIAGKASFDDYDDVPLLIRDLGLGSSVAFPGWLGTEDVISAMSACDILTIPRIRHIANEAGSPTKLAEYLSVGKPVVAAAVGDIPIYLQDGVDALLVEPGNVDSLVDALELLVDNGKLRVALANSGRRTAGEIFDYRKAASRIESAMADASV